MRPTMRPRTGSSEMTSRRAYLKKNQNWKNPVLFVNLFIFVSNIYNKSYWMYYPANLKKKIP